MATTPEENSARINELEIQLAYAERLVEELNAVVTEQADRVELLEKRVERLLNVVGALKEQVGEDVVGAMVEDDPVPSSG